MEITVATSRQIMNALEPLTCLAAFDVNGGLTLWTNNQRQMLYRKAVAGLFDMPEAKINVICEYTGGSFGEGNFPIVPDLCGIGQEDAEACPGGVHPRGVQLA